MTTWIVVRNRVVYERQRIEVESDDVPTEGQITVAAQDLPWETTRTVDPHTVRIFEKKYEKGLEWG